MQATTKMVETPSRLSFSPSYTTPCIYHHSKDTFFQVAKQDQAVLDSLYYTFIYVLAQLYSLTCVTSESVD